MATTVLAGVPSDYGELARLYEADVRMVVRKRMPWAESWDIDETVQYILQQFLPDPKAHPPRRGVLDQYDPAYISEKTGRPVPFRSFILAKVPLYCRYRAERLGIHGSREILMADAPVGDGSSTWVEAVADAPLDLSGLEDGQALERLRSLLAGRPSPPGQPGLLALFDEISGRVEAGKPATEAALARKYRKPPAVTAAWLAGLRDELRAAVAGDHRCARQGAREIGGMWLSDAQLREAARLLRASDGNQVVRVWERGGHPLAAAGKTWYLKPAKAELVAYPYLRGAKGGHYEGGHGSPVKRGLIHWLERLAGDEARPVAPEWAALLTALSALPGATPDLVDSAMAVVGAMFEEQA